MLYPDQLMKLPSVAAVVSPVWALVAAGVGMISRVPILPFASSRSSPRLPAPALHHHSHPLGCYKDFFGSTETIGGLAQVVFVPNVRLRVTLQQFEDERLEFIRLDLVLPGAVASADALQAVVGSGHEAEAEAMEIVGCGSWRGSPHISARKTRADMGERRRTARNILAQPTEVHLTSDNYVCYTCAAMTIDLTLFIKKGNLLL
ncbi:hypothetical protein FIBSPDRAFT_965847 [Athelia psychrophila]|uniref:Uncharacterized protein n=1 Tax=Athelia psychrophila TaxID=1759441 RepID=A0A167XFY1_9AGAM|nr:hypothetical protein FIBSPDRAFT_965847 [Fibularhizoctonia sp. CBS 109695]